MENIPLASELQLEKYKYSDHSMILVIYAESLPQKEKIDGLHVGD